MLTWLGLVGLGVALRARHLLPMALATLCLLLVVVNDSEQIAFFRRERGAAFAGATILLDFVFYLAHGLGIVLGWITRQFLGDPRPGPRAEAFTEMSIERWPPVPARRVLDSRPSPPPDQKAGDRAAQRTSSPSTIAPEANGA